MSLGKKSGNDMEPALFALVTVETKVGRVHMDKGGPIGTMGVMAQGTVAHSRGTMMYFLGLPEILLGAVTDKTTGLVGRSRNVFPLSFGNLVATEAGARRNGLVFVRAVALVLMAWVTG